MLYQFIQWLRRLRDLICVFYNLPFIARKWDFLDWISHIVIHWEKCLMKAIIYLVRIEVSQALNSGKYVERGFESRGAAFEMLNA